MINIKKRSGKIVDFNPNKIYKRIKDQCFNLKVDIDLIFQKVISGICSEMTTKEIDSYIATCAADQIIQHPDYSYLASRILITRQSKEINVIPEKTDYEYDFFGISSFFHKYSLRDDNGNPIELPHMMYKRVSDYLEVPNLYENISNRNISLATPILINSGTERKSLISCNITTLKDDSLEGINDTLNCISTSSKDAAGIGLHIHNLRSKESLVSSFKGNAGGVIRFADMVQSHMRFFKQGNRAGSCAITLGVWHKDILDFIDLKAQVGQDELRTRDLFTTVAIPDLFMKKLISGDDDWYLFCPNDLKLNNLKPLHDCYGEEFESIYNNAVSLNIGKKVSLLEIWNKILHIQVEAGNPCIFFWDNANKNNWQENIGIIRGSNLCVEFMGVSDVNMTSQCCLGLINLANLKLNDFDEIRKRTRLLVITLNKIIDKNKWSTIEAEFGGLGQRTIGIGIAGLADYYAKHNINFISEESSVFNNELLKVINEESIIVSSELAKVIGNYPMYKNSYWDKNDIPMRNSLRICLMPSASTSVLLGVNEMFEPFESNIFIRKIDKAEFIMINKWLVKDLENLNLWNNDIRSKILNNNGSVQNIKEIPLSIQEKYKTIWEIKQKDLIDLAAIRQNHIDQGQSLNLYFKDPTSGKIGAAIKYCWEKGLKTIYYTKTKSKLEAPKRLGGELLPEKPKDSIFECFGCTV